MWYSGIVVVLDFLADLFDKGYQYSTICGHRSAISAYHGMVDSVKVGDHPQVSALIAGIFNKSWINQDTHLYGMYKRLLIILSQICRTTQICRIRC